jgi:hypothetical protein|tara:strand:+ start:2104 stop:2433 length:330 start_codon:yes stop_codon:yes gene_type:complete
LRLDFATYKTLAANPAARSPVITELSAMPDEYCLNEFEAALLTGLSVKYLRKQRSLSVGRCVPFVKLEPETPVKKSTDKLKRKRVSRSKILYPLGRLRSYLGLKGEDQR